jgi:uncharacterized protein (TIGR03437 family)
MFRYARYLTALILFLAVARPGVSQTVTYSEHIAPLLYNNCIKCHRPNQVAPFSLLTYDDATRHGRDMVVQTQSRFMPPWKPEPGWTKYRDERRLTPQQIALIKQWVDDGMPQGDMSKAPPLPVLADGWQLGTPDLILEMPQSYTVQTDGPDEYRNFVIPSGVLEDKYVRAIEVKPLARSVVHHILFFSDTTGGARKMDGRSVSQGGDGKPGFPGLGSIFTVGDPLALLNGGLGAWVPGTTPAFLPNGIATPLPKGADLLLQTHFHSNGIPQTEKTVVGLYFGPKPTREMTQIQVPPIFGYTSHLDIPAGESNYKLRGSYTLPADVEAVSVWAHTHYLGREAKLTATLPTGEVRILLWIRQWDFNWQDTYIFDDLVSLPKGTRLDGELTYDNSSNNVRNPNNPPKRITWGEQSTDEMGSLIMNVLPKAPPDYDTLLGGTLAYILTPVPLVGARPLMVSSGLVDGASAQPGAVTPGKIVVIYGSRIGPTVPQSAAPAGGGRISTNLGGTQVLFDGVPAPLLYATSGQVAAVVPYGIDTRPGTQVQVKNGNLVSDPIPLPVTPVAPSIFSTNYTGTGPSAVLNQDGLTLNTAKTPAPKGSVISIYATGEGQTSPAGVDGLIATGTEMPHPTRAVKVWIDGKAAEVTYAGAASGQVAGLLQVNVKVPADAASGEVAIEIQVGEAKSQAGMTIAVK